MGIIRNDYKVHIPCHNVDSWKDDYQLRCALAILTFWMGLLVMINSRKVEFCDPAYEMKTPDKTGGIG